MITPKELQLQLQQKDNGPKLQDLYAQRSDINEQISNLEKEGSINVFKQITLPQLRKIWNKADGQTRYHILEANPYVVEHIEKLESHGGLNYGEIEQTIIDEKWGKAEYLEDVDDYYKDYCR